MTVLGRPTARPAEAVRTGWWAGPDGHLVESAMIRALRALSPTLRARAAYHLGWRPAPHGHGTGGTGVDVAHAPMAGRGKGLRAAMVLGAARAWGEPGGPEAATAAAVELVHAFTLVHDDVMDSSPTRRAAPTVWRLWGVNAAILLGDALQAAATRTLLLDVAEPYRGPAVVLLQDCVLELCHGQDLDAGPSAEFADVDPVQVAEAKTGSLMGAACGLGALVAGAPPEVVDRLAEVGRTVGVAFQLADDVLGVWGEPTRTGKPAGLDLLECRPTFPIILALRSGTSSGDGLRRWLDERRHGRTSDVEAARALLDSLEVRVACEAEVQRLRDHALRRLNDVPRTDVLAGLVHQILSPPS